MVKTNKKIMSRHVGKKQNLSKKTGMSRPKTKNLGKSFPNSRAREL